MPILQKIKKIIKNKLKMPLNIMIINQILQNIKMHIMISITNLKILKGKHLNLVNIIFMQLFTFIVRGLILVKLKRTLNVFC